MTILQTIQNIKNDSGDCVEMYFHHEGRRILYDGYYNLFTAEKWAHYTNVKSLCLELSSEGAGRVVVTSSAKGCLTEFRLDVPKNKKRCSLRMEVPNWMESGSIWIEWEPEWESTLLEGCFLSEDIPDRQIRMAAVICTYRRETYVERNIRILRKNILDNVDSPVYGKVDLFITDNGRTLDETAPLFLHDHITLFKNINAGGSGGFCRGMLEALKQRDLTHLILMDDDIVISAEALIRIYALLCYLKAEYRDSCVGGELLDLDRPYILNEAGATYNKGMSEIPLREFDLRSREQVMKAEQIRRADYAGWWFACYPMTVVRPDNLPLPLFIHFDDIEYGLRNADGIIYLNGISVRHAGFTNRFSAANTYYTVRNRLVTNALRSPDVGVHHEIQYIRNMFLYEALRYTYFSADLIELAVIDFCKGARAFGRINPEQKNEQVRGIAARFVPFEEIADTPQMLEKLNEYADRCVQGTGYTPRIGKTGYRYTCNGWLMPASKDSKTAFCSLFHEDMRELFRCSKGILVDPYARKGLVVEKSYRKLLHLLGQYRRIERMMRKHYSDSADSFRRNEKVLESRRFWEKYLHLA